MEELSDGALQSAVGGRINLRVDGPGKPPPDSHGAGGPLHPGDDRFNIYWPHGYW
jgi:hypothetical protein